MPSEVLWASWQPDLSVGSAVRLLPTSGRVSAHSLRGEQSIATPSPGCRLAGNRPGYRSQGMPSQMVSGPALISLISSKAPRTSTVNSAPESAVIVGGVRVLTEKRVFRPICPDVLLPCALQTSRQDSSTRGSVTPAQPKPMKPQRPRSPPTTRATTARPRSAMLLGSAEGRPRAPIGRTAMAS